MTKTYRLELTAGQVKTLRAILGHVGADHPDTWHDHVLDLIKLLDAKGFTSEVVSAEMECDGQILLPRGSGLYFTRTGS